MYIVFLSGVPQIYAWTPGPPPPGMPPAQRPIDQRRRSPVADLRARERVSAATGNMPGPGAEARRREGQQCYECGRPTHFQVRRGDKGANRKVRIGRSRSGSQRVSESDMFATFLGEKCLGLSVTPSEDITAAVETSPSTVILGFRAMQSTNLIWLLFPNHTSPNPSNSPNVLNDLQIFRPLADST